MDNKFASINYCATTTATLAQLNRLIPKASYTLKAKELARMIVGKMNPEHFIEGEGSREGKYKYGIDIGYNMEMSLWGVGRYAQLTGDTMVNNAIAAGVANHLWFIYPNGVLDGSSGIRSNKWTMFGSGTSDGCHPTFALYAEQNPAYVTAAIKNIEQAKTSLTKHGLLGTGPHYDRLFDTPPCIYPTFTKAKSMAMAIEWAKAENTAPMPTQKEGYRHFKTIGVLIARSKNFCGTITAYNYKAKEGADSKYMHRPSGGSITALWVDGFDMLQLSSQSEYRRWEPMSFPHLGEVKPLTPRIEVTTEADTYTNLYEYDSAFCVDRRDGVVESTTYGLLKNSDQRPCGVTYTLSHSFNQSKLTKSYVINHQTIDNTIQIIEPIALNENLTLEQIAPDKIKIERNGRVIMLTLQGKNTSMRIDKAEASKYHSIYPAMKMMPIVVDVPLDTLTRRSYVVLSYEVTN